MEKDWFLFQEEIKEYFENLGCDSKTNVSLKGVRTKHDIDVLVKSKFLGHNITWVIEAKKWKSKVSKLHVLALRQIVDDIGADKGFIISEKGFQKGAIEASKNTNIQLLTYEELKTITDNIFHKEILNGYLDRVSLNINRYYSHDKDIRIKYNLRADPLDISGKFNVYILLMVVVSALDSGLNGNYPIFLNSHFNEQFGGDRAENFYQLINWLNLNLLVIEERILKAEIEMQKNDDFNPSLWYTKTEENVHIKMLNIIAEKGGNRMFE